MRELHHVVFECRFVRERVQLETMTGRLVHSDNLIDIMLENQKLWDAVSSLATVIMRRLRSTEHCALWRAKQCLAAVPPENLYPLLKHPVVKFIKLLLQMFLKFNNNIV